MNTLQKVFDNFKWDYKNKYEHWIILYSNRDRHTFLGRTNKPGNDEYIIVKQIKMNKYYDDILREIYFYACCNKNKYFNETLDVSLSEDGRYLFLILKNEGIDLKEFVNVINTTGNITYVKDIIFQVVKGLKILHKNNLSHNDLKPSNIIITAQGNAKIWGFHLTSKVSTIRYSGINGYYSPQALLGKSKTKEDDMWSVGVIYFELVKKRMGIFQIPINGPIYEYGKEILQYILENLYDIKLPYTEWNEDINYKYIINLINEGIYNKFESRLKKSLLTDVDDADKEIIMKLLELDPSKRMTAEQLLNSSTFQAFNNKLLEPEINYNEIDYNRYFKNHKPENLDEFKEYLEEIKEKFFGIAIFE